jgi:hypothetical protein
VNEMTIESIRQAQTVYLFPFIFNWLYVNALDFLLYAVPLPDGLQGIALLKSWTEEKARLSLSTASRGGYSVPVVSALAAVLSDPDRSSPFDARPAPMDVIESRLFNCDEAIRPSLFGEVVRFQDVGHRWFLESGHCEFDPALIDALQYYCQGHIGDFIVYKAEKSTKSFPVEIAVVCCFFGS